MKQLNRWVYAIVGVIVLLFAGLVYAWSVLSTPIGAEFTGWTKAQLSLTFTLVMILFCIGSLLCGLLAGRLSAKNAVRLGAVLFLAGFFIASRCQSPLTLYLGFGTMLVACMGGVLLAGIIMGLASAGLLGALSGLFAVG